MSAARVTRGGAAAADAAREKQKQRESKTQRARAQVRGGVSAGADLEVEDPQELEELLTAGTDTILGRAKVHMEHMGGVIEAMDAAIEVLRAGIREHLVRQDDEIAPQLRLQLREVLVARRRLEAQRAALEDLCRRGGVGGPVVLPGSGGAGTSAGAAAAPSTVAQPYPGARHARSGAPVFRLDDKLRPTDWRARLDARVAAHLSPAGGWNVDRELRDLDRLARRAKVKLHDGMRSQSEDGSDDDGQFAPAGGSGDSDDSDVRVAAAPRGGGIPGVNNQRCPITQKELAAIEKPVIDRRGYVYEQEAVEAELARYRGGAMPHPQAGVTGALTKAELTVAKAVIERFGRGLGLKKFVKLVDACERAGATAPAIVERQRRDQAEAAKKKKEGGGKKKAAAAADGDEDEVVCLDDSDAEMAEASPAAKKGGKGKKKKAPAAARKGGRLRTKAQAGGEEEEEDEDEDEDGEEGAAAAAGGGEAKDSELPKLQPLSDEEEDDDEEAAAAEYVRLEEEDEEEEEDGGGRGGRRRRDDDEDVLDA